MGIETEYRRGYQDGRAGRDRDRPTRDNAVNSFLDGLFGSRFEDEAWDAYNEGYRLGREERLRDAEPAAA